MISLLSMSICLLIFNCTLSGSCKVSKLLEVYYNKTASDVKKSLGIKSESSFNNRLLVQRKFDRFLHGYFSIIFPSILSCTSSLLLNLFNIAHPLTGDMLAEKILQSLVDWNIPTAKILAIITDNDSNMIRGVKTANVLSANVVQLADKSSDEEIISEDEVSTDNEAKS